MTQDEIIRSPLGREQLIALAREAGMTIFVIESLERFAALVAAHEREACAKVCDAVDSLIATIQTVGIPNVGARKVLNKACEEAAKCAAAIRERSANARARSNK